MFKKDDRTDKSNYRPISMVLSKCRCGFRKGFSAQHCLIKLLEQWKKSIDQGLVFGALLTGLLKAFDCQSHELLVAKLSAYGIEDPAVRVIYDYLTNRIQRTKMAASTVLREMFFLAYLNDQF